jgi:hypothetical protein
MTMATQVVSPQRAQGIMGKKFIGVESVEGFWRVQPTKQQLSVSLGRVPFSEERLEASRKTHFLVAFLPLSIEDMRVEKGSFFPWTKHEGQPFAQERGKAKWELMAIDPSVKHKSLGAQRYFLKEEGEKLTTARAAIYFLITNYLQTGHYLFDFIRVRTSSRWENESVVINADPFPDLVFYIDHCPDMDCKPDLGAVHARRCKS